MAVFEKCKAEPWAALAQFMVSPITLSIINSLEWLTLHSIIHTILSQCHEGKEGLQVINNQDIDEDLTLQWTQHSPLTVKNGMEMERIGLIQVF